MPPRRASYFTTSWSAPSTFNPHPNPNSNPRPHPHRSPLTFHPHQVNALDLRKPGQQILYRLDGAGREERPMVLRRPLRRKGPDCWLAERARGEGLPGWPQMTILLRGCFSPRTGKDAKRADCLAVAGRPSSLVEIYLSEATHDEMWRLKTTA
eukprot:scaffold69388_cov70-Phaeocystis_antarctica.AAC.3